MKVTPHTLHKIAAVCGVLALASVIGLACLTTKKGLAEIQDNSKALPIPTSYKDTEIMDTLPLPTEAEVLGIDLLMPEIIPAVPKKSFSKKKTKH